MQLRIWIGLEHQVNRANLTNQDEWSVAGERDNEITGCLAVLNFFDTGRSCISVA